MRTHTASRAQCPPGPHAATAIVLVACIVVAILLRVEWRRVKPAVPLAEILALCVLEAAVSAELDFVHARVCVCVRVKRVPRPARALFIARRWCLSCVA